jgi:hypothetical protein
MKKSVLVAISILTVLTARSQESQEVYSFLRLPVSAHVAALGGDNITLTDDDPTLIFHNPALLNGVSYKSINLNFMTYMEGAMTLSTSFVKTAKERATWGVSAQYMSYGEMKETTVNNEQTGTFSAKDIALAGSFAYMLTNRLSGGITARFISSSLGSYNSLAMAVDLGVNYYDTEREWSLSAVAKNLGGQVKAYDDEFERIPIDLQLGVSKRLIGSPLRLSVTMSRLHKWNTPFLQHFAIGADALLGYGIYVAAGYNFRRSSEMKITDTDGDSNHGAGISFGAGIQTQRFKLHAAYAKYHVSAWSLLINATYSL